MAIDGNTDLIRFFTKSFHNYCAGFHGFSEIVWDCAALIELCGTAPAHPVRRPDKILGQNLASLAYSTCRNFTHVLNGLLMWKLNFEKECAPLHLHYIYTYAAVSIVAHALALGVCSMCSLLIAVGFILNLRVNAVILLLLAWWQRLTHASKSLIQLWTPDPATSTPKKGNSNFS